MEKHRRARVCKFTDARFCQHLSNLRLQNRFNQRGERFKCGFKRVLLSEQLSGCCFGICDAWVNKYQFNLGAGNLQISYKVKVTVHNLHLLLFSEALADIYLCLSSFLCGRVE